VLGGGRVLADETVEEVRGMVGVHRVSLTAAALPELPGVVAVEHTDDRTHVLTTDADALVRALIHSGAPFAGLEVRPTSLEEAFLAITAAPQPATV